MVLTAAQKSERARKAWATRRKKQQGQPQPKAFRSKGKGKQRKVIPIMPKVVKPLPRRIISPMLAERGPRKEAERIAHLQRDERYVQRKYDGTRGLIIKEGDEVLMVGRSWKLDYLPNFPEIEEEIRKLPVHSCILDTELTFFKKGTDEDEFLTALATSSTKAPYVAKAMVFDVLYVNGENVENKPFEERMEIYDQVVPDNFKFIKEVQTIKERKAKVDLYKESGAKKREGVVSKLRRSPYREGQRTTEWYKIKNWEDDDAVIVGYTQGTGANAPTFGSVVLGQWTPRGWRYVGKASGFTDKEQREILAKMNTLRVQSPTLTEGKIPPVKAWVKPQIVVEVKFLEQTKAGVYRHPSFERERPDKGPRECVFRRR